jgi:hypothetical protein
MPAMANVIPWPGDMDSCPAWCTIVHDADDPLDRAHRSRETAFRIMMALPRSRFGFVSLVQWAGRPEPFVHIDLPDDEQWSDTRHRVALRDAEELASALHDLVRLAES